MSLQVSGLEFSYGSKTVLRGIDIAPLQAGQLTALVGPNATGKSTLFRCIAGLLSAQHGRVVLNGNELTQLAHDQRCQQVCYMPQVFSSNASLTVFEVVLLAKKHLRGWLVEDEDLLEVERILNRVGISALAQAYIGELSGGQQQLVSICQALVRSPWVYLLDEPTSALDLRHQLDVMNIIRERTQQNHSVTIAAIHDLNLAARFADRLLLMRDGQIVAAGPPEEILVSDALAQTYGVKIETARTADGQLLVAAGR